MAQLAIKGHPTKGKEVIEILEMLGGENEYKLNGCNIECAYYKKNGVIRNTSPVGFNNIKLFTLEDFLEKFPYKIGDKVQHKGATSCGSVFEVEKMRWEEDTVKYTLHLFGCNYKTSTLPAEYLQPYKEETMEKEISGAIVNRFICLEGYDFYDDKDNIIDTKEITMKKKKPKYPKTFVECAKILDCFCAAHIDGYYCRLLEDLQALLICRDAYWKVAGEQMGLGKPWECDMSKDEFSFAISYQYGYIQKCEIRHQNEILIFPTKEMRDAFYENFKELIELVKELL